MTAVLIRKFCAQVSLRMCKVQNLPHYDFFSFYMNMLLVACVFDVSGCCVSCATMAKYTIEMGAGIKKSSGICDSVVYIVLKTGWHLCRFSKVGCRVTAENQGINASAFSCIFRQMELQIHGLQ